MTRTQQHSPFSEWPLLAVLLLLGGCWTGGGWIDDAESYRPALPAPSNPEDFSDAAPYAIERGEKESSGVEALEGLTVEEAVVLALEHNRDLQVARLQPVVEGAFEAIERSFFDLEAYLSVQAREEQVTQTTRATGEQFDVFGKDASGEAGVRQRLPTGTEVDVSLGLDRSISDRTPEQQSARLGLSVTQPLLRGAGPKVNLIRVRQAEVDTLASTWELRGFTESLLAQVEIAYWRLVLAREQIRIFEESLRLAKSQQAAFEERIAVGALPENQGAVVRAEVAAREQALINARGQLESRRLTLLRLLGVDRTGQLDLAIQPGSVLEMDPLAMPPADEAIERALDGRPELREAELRFARDELETVLTRNGRLPRLDFFVNLGRSGFASTLEDSLGNIDGDDYDATVGVRLSTLIGNREARARDLAARAGKQQALEAVLNQAQLVELEVRLALTEVERTRQQIGASAVTRELRELTALAERERFQVGSSTALQVAQAQRDLLESQIVEVEAMVSYRIALIQFYLAEGTLLERRGIGFDFR